MSKHAFLAFVLSALLLPAVSQAITNGDFESGLSGWTATDYGPNSSVVITSGVSGDTTKLAHLSAAADFTWDDDLGWQGDFSQADLFTTDFFILGQGERTLSFQALAETSGSGNEPAYVGYAAQYGPDPLGITISGEGQVDITSSTWNTYSLDLLDDNGNFLPAGSMITVFARAQAIPSYSGTIEPSETITSDLYLDNFTTTVIPEPVTMLSLLIAVVGNAAYLRRRMAA